MKTITQELSQKPHLWATALSDRSILSYCLKVHWPLSRMPLLAPAHPHRTVLWVCRQNRWSTSTAPVNTTPCDHSVTHKIVTTSKNTGPRSLVLVWSGFDDAAIKAPGTQQRDLAANRLVYFFQSDKQGTISELEPLWSFMAFSCTFPMAASAHSAREMRRTPVCNTNTQEHGYLDRGKCGKLEGFKAKYVSKLHTHIICHAYTLTMRIQHKHVVALLVALEHCCETVGSVLLDLEEVTCHIEVGGHFTVS